MIFMILVSNIKQNICDTDFDMFEVARKKGHIEKKNILNAFIYKKSLDARNKNNICFVYTIAFELADESLVHNSACKRIHDYRLEIAYGNKLLCHRPIVVGLGPAGLFCSYFLALNGYKPIVFERGKCIEERIKDIQCFFEKSILNEESNIQFGEGGAGTFSDGKLTTRIGDPCCTEVLKLFVKFGAPKEILYEAKPHIGTDLLRNIIIKIRDEILSLGADIYFNSKFSDFKSLNGYLQEVTIDNRKVEADVCVLAIGHSSRDTFRMLYNHQIDMEAKPFSVGTRIEHLQESINYGLYGKQSNNPLIPPGEYQLSNRDDSGRAVYTFCMCPGGSVVPATSVDNCIVTNGMSFHSRKGRNANSALVVSVDSNDYGTDPLSGMYFQEKIEKKAFELTGSYKAPFQTVGLFLEGKPGAKVKAVEPTYSLGVSESNFSDLFPSFIVNRLKSGLLEFNKKIDGFSSFDALLTAPETRTSSPVRILRNSITGFSNSVTGLYPCGEGCGYAGGIMSAAVDGIHVALKIMNEYKPLL